MLEADAQWHALHEQARSIALKEWKRIADSRVKALAAVCRNRNAMVIRGSFRGGI